MFLEHPIRVLITAWSRYATVKIAHDIGFMIRKGNRSFNFSKICVFIISPPLSKKEKRKKVVCEKDFVSKGNLSEIW